MKSQKKQIWSKVGNYPANYLETVKNQAEAEATVRIYERQDRYEVEQLGYTNELPKYEIRDAV